MQKVVSNYQILSKIFGNCSLIDQLCRGIDMDNSCFDKGAVVVLFHGIQKKSQKTPPKEIRRAEAIKKEYFKSKGEDKK